MTVEILRTGWLPLFQQMRSPNMFLSRHFTVKPGGIYSGAKIAIDIERSGEDLAIAIQKCSGPNMNDIDEWTTKEFEPPAYGEAFPCDVCELINRMAGVDPFTDAYNGYAASFMAKLSKGFKLIDDKIRRSVEFQASQVLQNGTMTLVNKAGDTTYSIDFKPKSSHFPTVGVSWSSVATADPIADLLGLANIIRADGQIDCNKVIMGQTALKNFLENDKVKAALDNRRMEVGAIAPRFADSGATFYGFVWVGTYAMEIWAYPDTFKDPVTSNVTKYVADTKVIMMSTNTRFDMTSAIVPLPLGPDPRVANLMPGRMSSAEDGFDVTPNLYSTPNGKQIMGELESRPLLIPVQIDGYGCLTTET